MANMKEAQMAKEELLDNIQKFVLCGRAMLDAIEQIAIQSAVFKVQSADETPAEGSPDRTRRGKAVGDHRSG